MPESGLASAQGIWTVVSSGIATFAGSFAGEIIAELLGLKNLFIIVTIILIILGIFTPFMIRENESILRG